MDSILRNTHPSLLGPHWIMSPEYLVLVVPTVGPLMKARDAPSPRALGWLGPGWGSGAPVWVFEWGQAGVS